MRVIIINLMKMKFKYIVHVLIFASIVYISGCDVTGDFVYTFRSTTCVDSDDGKTFDVAGKVTLNTLEFYDRCTSTDSVREYFCQGIHKKGIANAPCSIVGKSGCLAGKCIDSSVTWPLVSSDTDGGKNFTEFGYVTVIGGKEFMDFCLNKVMVREYYLLPNGKKAYSNYLCDNGCKDGACI